jgi:hypothetical protein
VSSSHQRAAWRVAGSDPTTQEGYDRALKGPPRPSDLSEALAYKIELTSWRPPRLGLRVQCVVPSLYQEGERQAFLLDLVQEVAARLRTVATVHSVSCTAVGPWGTDRALLRKHWGLEHVLASMADSRALVRAAWGGVRGVRREEGFVRGPQAPPGSQGGFLKEMDGVVS